MPALIYLTAAALGLLRVVGLFGLFAGHPLLFQVFKDAAHLYVGGLIGAAVLARRFGVGPFGLLVWAAVALSALETACAAASFVAKG